MSAQSPRIGIVGAGLGGIALAVKLARAGIDSFTVFERAAGPGGVWWQNTYPGCEVDIDSHAYSYSFMPYDWSGTHAKAPELRNYVRDVIERFGIGDRFRFGTGVREVVWDDDRRLYVLTTDDGQAHDFEVVVSAVGMLSDPNLPDWPGLEEFEGPVFHTSRYEHEHDLSDKRVAVVGTGSTACQLVPELARSAKHVDLYQREPGWVMPKRARVYTPEERERFRRSPLRQKIDRFRLFRGARQVGDGLRADGRNQPTLRGYAEHYITKTVPDETIRDAVTPRYAYGCKRPVFASSFYPALSEPNVDLIPCAVRAATPTGLVDAQGTERAADVLILATGFRAADYLTSLPVVGPGGRDLQRAWDGEPSAFLGITVPGFPNFFILYGPNTNGGWSIITQLERQAEVVVRQIRRLRRHRGRVCDTDPTWARRYDAWVQRKITERLSSAESGCHNYYTSATGKNVTQWPLSHTAYLATTRLLSRVGLKIRPPDAPPRKEHR